MENATLKGLRMRHRQAPSQKESATDRGGKGGEDFLTEKKRQGCKTPGNKSQAKREITGSGEKWLRERRARWQFRKAPGEGD